MQAIWDEVAEVFYSKCDIDGLHIEAESIEEFCDSMLDLAPELIMANHVSSHDLVSRPIAAG